MAITASYNSDITNQRAQLPYTVASADTVYAGAFAQLDSTGAYVTMGALHTAYKVVGEFVKDLVSATANTSVSVREGDILKDNSAIDPVIQADVGKTVYVYDNATVCHTSTLNGKAGVFMGFDVNQPTKCRVRCTQECT
jgi:hypothetical protein